MPCRRAVIDSASIFFFGYAMLALLTLPASGQSSRQVPRPDHVVIVIEENKAYAQIIGSSSAPYINALATQGALFSESFALSHPSQPNYLALFSGSTQGLKDNSCPHSFPGDNLASELIAGGFTFAGYSESLPAIGFSGCRSGNYTRKHNPWVNFSNLPASVNLPMTSFPADFRSLPTVAFVIPDLQNDMHDGSIQAGDEWLREHLEAYVSWAQTNNSLLVVTFDEDNGLDRNHIPTLMVGAMVQPGTYPDRINHYGLLRTLEDMFGVPYAGYSAGASPVLRIWKSADLVRKAVPLSSSGDAAITEPGTTNDSRASSGRRRRHGSGHVP